MKNKIKILVVVSTLSLFAISYLSTGYFLPFKLSFFESEKANMILIISVMMLTCIFSVFKLWKDSRQSKMVKSLITFGYFMTVLLIMKLAIRMFI